MTDPKIENKESLVKFLNKKELDTSNIYCVSFEEFKPTLELSKNKIPDVLIFNKMVNIFLMVKSGRVMLVPLTLLKN